MNPPRARLISLGKKLTVINGQPVSYLLKRSLRAKTVRFQVLPGQGLTVTIPRSYDPDDVPKVIQKYASWVLSKLAAVSAVRRDDKREPVPGDNIPYLGRALPLVVTRGPDRLYRVRLEPDGLVIGLGSGNVKLSILLEYWYRREAARVIKRKLDDLSTGMGSSYNRLFIRGQRTRWGSCSARRNLCFNWKLIMAPEPVIEYVIIHELAHLQQMNHGKKFWGLVGRHCPAWREHKQWLQQHASVADWPFITARACGTLHRPVSSPSQERIRVKGKPGS